MTKLRVPGLRPLLLIACLAGLAMSPVRAQVSGASTDPERPRMVVLVTIDSLRADAVSLPGQPRKITTYLTRLVYGGAVFPRVYAPSSQGAPSMASLFTGLYPASHGVRAGVLSPDVGEVVGQPRLSDDLTTLAERMKQAGYTTIGVPASRNLSSRLGFAQGFDHYSEQGHFAAASKVNREVYRLLAEAYGSQWRQELRKRYTFLWVHYTGPRLPYVAREPWIHSFAASYRTEAEAYPEGLGKKELEKIDFDSNYQAASRVRPLYQSEVASVDASFRRLAQALEMNEPDVAIVVTSGHGTELAERGGFGHGDTLYEEVVRVPLLVRWPARVRPFTRVDEPVSLLDVFPTLMDMCGGRQPYGLQGISLHSALQGGQVSTGRQFLFELSPTAWDGGRPWLGMVEGDWKLIERQVVGDRRARRDNVLLFDLASDPKERRNLAAANRGLVESLGESLETRRQSLPAPPSRPSP